MAVIAGAAVASDGSIAPQPPDALRAGGESVNADIDEILVSGIRPASASPYGNLTLPANASPSHTQHVSGQEIRDSHATSLTDFMRDHLQSISVSDYQGNPFQADVQYRGFSASPQIGSPQGLSVFLDGIRVNEPFGDVVNWDLLPLNAMRSLDLVPGNPLFGRNTLGGALNLRTRNGFEDEGVQASVSGGSWGRIHGQLALGGQQGALAGFLALSDFHEEGWRDDSPSDVRQGFAKVSLQQGRLKADLSSLVAENRLVGNGLVPLGLARDDYSAVFTSPDRSDMALRQVNLEGLLSFTDQLALGGQIYRRQSVRRGRNGDIYRAFDDMSSTVRGAEAGTVEITNALPLCQFVDANHNGVPDAGAPLNNPGNGVGICDRTVAVGGGPFRPRNGKADGTTHVAQDGPGIVTGTPIGTLNRLDLDQRASGGNIHFDVNSEHHHAMLGLALDVESARYFSRSRLADINAAHEVVPFAQESLIDPLNFNRFYAAYNDVTNNRFRGTSSTSSVFLSETFSPIAALHFNLGLRYNYTRVKNNLGTRLQSGLRELHQINPFDPRMFPFDMVLCPSADPASCPRVPNTSSVAVAVRDGTVVIPPDDPTQHVTDLGGHGEKFRYHALNPNFGVSFIPIEGMDLFANYSEGSRTPSVVELGCALDSKPAHLNPNEPSSPVVPVSLLQDQGGSCTLPTALSGDPYLPQIRSVSGELGIRGSTRNGWDWNLVGYRTDIHNDIYFVGVTQERSFFDTIDKTRREGLELGFGGKRGRLGMRFNYSFVSATFESPFHLFGLRNSSADFDINGGVRPDVVYPIERFLEPDGNLTISVDKVIQTDHLTKYGLSTYRFIKVEPGDRMPGVPAHNFNANLDFDITPRWRLGLTVLARSSSILRGNENNDHRAGAAAQEPPTLFGDLVFDNTGNVVGVRFNPDAGFRNRQPFDAKGQVGGYFIFNLETAFELRKGWTLSARIDNLLDRRYYSAGRLDANPFSPSIFGAVGPSGWNYNSKDWKQTSLVAPGAPRAAWLGLDYRY
ncbi:MAG: TonB-dependent receptor [Gammaproteobacteria bacterium]|nr:TonB-dependent receptor [Gammaproteobacteria bacterium]